MAKYRLKKQAKQGIALIIVIIVLGIASIIGLNLYKEYKYRQTYEYKLLQINYNVDETKILLNKLNNKQLDSILTQDYNENYAPLVNEKYFIYQNMERYLSYIKENKNSDYTSVVALVNVKRDTPFYENTIETDISKGRLMLVNKYHNLTDSYEPENIQKIDLSYAYNGNSIIDEVANAFQELHHDAKEQGYTIVINSSYRTYQYQEDLWNSRKSTQGAKKADQFVARAGHSEHQTGYAIDVSDFHDINDKFEETESFIWMSANCHKYGFILRYPKDKEDITGYGYEAWHYRYVGKEIAEKIFNEGITFDEYYAYYIEK